MNWSAYPRKAAVLGAGVMGSQIAAQFANANIEVLLYDLATSPEQPNAQALQALANLIALQPSPLASKHRARHITPSNYYQHLDALRGCDLVIEAVSERMDCKEGIYARIAPYVHRQALIVSNTSGLSISTLARALPESLRPRFCGMQFFHPARYRRLVELVPGRATDPRVLDSLETFLVTGLGKGVIRAKDTPNFIANRIAIFALLAAMHHAEQYRLAPDQVDALTSAAFGLPGEATFGVVDAIGLDTLANIVESAARGLPDDGWLGGFTYPAWLRDLVSQGSLGAKVGAGVYRKQGEQRLVWDPLRGEYRTASSRLEGAVADLLGQPLSAQRLAGLRETPQPQAQFLWAVLRDVLHYSAYWLESIADSARDIDLAMRWGFGWRLGPLETWQALGWRRVAAWLEEDILAQRTPVQLALPDWVKRVDGVHHAKGSYAPAEGQYKPRSNLPVYRRQLFPELLVGEPQRDPGKTVFDSEAVRLWHQGDRVAILSFSTPNHAVTDAVLDGIMEALGIVGREFQALVLWQHGPLFTVGADLGRLWGLAQANDWSAVDKWLGKLQQVAKAIRYAPFPVVGAIQGATLGYGCELALHCDRLVAALETQMGFSDFAVGLSPVGGGCTELARRAAWQAGEEDCLPFIRRYFEAIALSKVSQSAEEAKQLGLMRANDSIVFNPYELLYVAKIQAQALAESGYRPLLRERIQVAGRIGLATLKRVLTERVRNGELLEHDYALGCKIAAALCGGDADPGVALTEGELLALERQAFLTAIKSAETRVRLGRALKNGWAA